MRFFAALFTVFLFVAFSTAALTTSATTQASQVDVKVTPNQCPTISWFFAGPLHLYVDGFANFEVTAKDRDANPISYVWLVHDDTGHVYLMVNDFKSTRPSFRCERPGEFRVMLWVSDGWCPAALQEATVHCYAHEE